ncbi:hypothetical protein VR010_05860 [Actinomycetaceae bacterium L2_0104]
MVVTVVLYKRFAAGLAVWFLIGAGLMGCTNGGSSANGSASLRGINPNAELDYENARVHLPSDYVTTRDHIYELSLIDSAAEGAVIKCAREEAGLDLKGYPIDKDEPTRYVFWKYGPWTEAVAEKFAFVPPMTDGELVANGLVPQSVDPVESPNLNPYADLSEADRQKIRDACASDPDAQKFDIYKAQSDGPGEVELQDAWIQVDSDARMKALVEELDACFRTRGMEVDPGRIGYPKSAEPNVINEDQIAMALKTVECKDKVDFTQRAVDILAEHQMDVIDEHADELFAARQEWDDLVADAKQYIEENPDVFVQPDAN